jgi:acetyl-CoA acetyltransferase family protein
MREAVIIDAVRTPIGRGHPEKGALRGWHPVKLYAHAIDALLSRTGLSPAKVSELATGCVTARGEQGNNVSRLAGLLSGLPPTTNAFTVVRACGSSQEAVHLAALKVLAGDADYVIAGGVESMGRVPMFSDIGTHDNVNPDLKAKYEIIHQGESAERLCEIHKLTQKDLDDFAVESHRRAWAAQQAGRFRAQIAPVTALDAAGNLVELAHDEGIREHVDAVKMAALPRPFRPGVGLVSAGNASQIADGAGALLIADRASAEQDGLRPRAYRGARLRRRRSHAGAAGGDPCHAAGAVPRRAHAPRDRPVRGERGLCTGAADLDARARHSRVKGERERRRHCARPSAWRHRRHPHGQAAERARAPRRALRAADHVHRAGHGYGDDHRADVGWRVWPREPALIRGLRQ